MDKNNERLSIALSTKMLDELKAHANAQKRTLSQYIRLVLEEHLEKGE